MKELKVQDIALNNESTPLVVAAAHQNYIAAATSANTRKAYQQDVRHFMAWGGLLPTTPDVIIRYLENYATELNPRTLVRRVTALKNWHLYQGFADPTAHPLLRKTLVGIKNIHGKPKDKAAALQVADLITMANFLRARGKLSDWRNNALLQIGFFGAFRRSELTAIQYEHVHFMPQGIEIIIPRSKTDQFGAGQKCAIPYGDQILCPVVALKAWCAKANIATGYIFRGITRGDAIMHKPIAAEHLNIIMKTLARHCNLPNADGYSSHSLRRGFATAASQRGASLSAIMKQGRWRHSDTALGYVEEGLRFEDNAASIVLGARDRKQP
jgi:integrase